jgi:hypothetical protein
MRRFLFTATLLILCLSSFAQIRKYSNEFLSLGVGSRAFGMSSAVAASSDDIYAAYWNPAALTQMQGKYQAALMHAEYFGSIAKYDYGAFAYKTADSSTLAFSIFRFGVDDIPNTTELIDAGGNINYDRITLFSAVDYAFITSYARKSKIKGLSLGGNVKIIHRRIGEFAQSWGFGIDAAAHYRLKKFNFGLVARDVSTTFNAWSYSLNSETIAAFQQTGNEIPSNALEITLPKFILATSYHSQLNEKLGLNAEVDLILNTDGQRNVLLSSQYVNVEPAVGLELDFRKIAYLRTGIGNIQQELDFDGSKNWSLQPNFGLGIRIKNINIDYALTDIGDLSAAIYSNVFSVKIQL